MYVHGRALLLHVLMPMQPTPHLHVHVAAYLACLLACSALQAHLFAPLAVVTMFALLAVLWLATPDLHVEACVRLFMYLLASLTLLALFAKLALLALLRCWLLHVHDLALLLHVLPPMQHPICTCM